ncbi:MAG: hypothetical protein K2W94_08750 [Alphaproteobacteria bacterium]|nr:hypothetical protein [Alphaproteobacteria bacterium]
MATTPILSLPESLKVYERFCRHKLGDKEQHFVISALSKGKEKLSPLLVYEISLLSLGCSMKGEGHSKEIAEFDCIVSALDHLDSLP